MRYSADIGWYYSVIFTWLNAKCVRFGKSLGRLCKIFTNNDSVIEDVLKSSLCRFGDIIPKKRRTYVTGNFFELDNSSSLRVSKWTNN